MQAVPAELAALMFSGLKKEGFPLLFISGGSNQENRFGFSCRLG
jgi:hypothetical protein